MYANASLRHDNELIELVGVVAEYDFKASNLLLCGRRLHSEQDDACVWAAVADGQLTEAGIIREDDSALTVSKVEEGRVGKILRVVDHTDRYIVSLRA